MSFNEVDERGDKHFVICVITAIASKYAGNHIELLNILPQYGSIQHNLSFISGYCLIMI